MSVCKGGGGGAREGVDFEGAISDFNDFDGTK